MGHLQVKNVPEDLHAELRRRARLEGETVRDYVLELIERDQRLPTKREWLERVRRRETVRLDRPVAELIAEDREERDRELAGRSSLQE
ncbi:MAG: hypothetical protein H0W51_04235 [Euzebyales bacterium]|nr:hypothetical protein [Euzebyales bacterium]MDQ3342598.1 hypothetical protein [Actinomycetota bacterium]